MRCILLVLDGLGDRGIHELGHRTPLQAANTPNLDRIAESGINGLYHSTMQGIAMPSEMAHFLIFGYDLADFPGRGYLEAIGEGLKLEPADVAILARLLHVTTGEGKFLLKKEKNIIDRDDFTSLIKDISPFSKHAISLQFIPTEGVGGIAVVSGEISPDITDTNPITEGRHIMSAEPFKGTLSPLKASRTAAFLNEYSLWSHERLSGNQVNIKREKNGLPSLNMVGFQRAGQKMTIPSFEMKWGLRALCIASGRIYQGLCSTLGMDIKKIPEFADPGEDLRRKLEAATDSRGYDFIYIHSKAPDEAAHKKDFMLKKKVIEDLDCAMGYALDEIIPDRETLFIVTSDHSTPSVGSMIHSGETVPLTMHGRYTRKDEVSSFDEISASKGGLGDVRGHEIMYMILNLLDRGKLKGLMDTPEDQPYTPGISKPLRWS